MNWGGPLVVFETWSKHFPSYKLCFDSLNGKWTEMSAKESDVFKAIDDDDDEALLSLDSNQVSIQS